MHEVNEIWTCIDDGTGRNVYYQSSKGIKVSKEPQGFNHRYLDNGERAYSFKGKCVQCYKPMSPIVLSRNSWHEVFCLNICESCIFKATGILSSRMKGNGDRIFDAFKSSPKVLFLNLMTKSLDPEREHVIHERAKSAKYAVLRKAKERRNITRYMTCKVRAAPYNVFIGSYMSWGFGEEYDEYFGKLSSTGVPHGLGVKFYSDGTVYVGGWSNGRPHTEGRGVWTRTTGCSYEGSWMQGRKHGKGEQIYEDGRVYVGEFANGFEHGRGRVKYSDGSLFEGRFRFGRRDGPGVFKSADGITEKGNFRDAVVTPEPPPPEVSEEEQDSAAFSHPGSLQKICLESLSEAMRRQPHRVPPPNHIQRRLVAFLKPLVGRAFLGNMAEGSEDFRLHGPKVAYSSMESICLGDVRMNYNDVAALIYFTEANSDLRTLHIVSSRLKTSSFEVLCRNLSRDIWPQLVDLDLSFSRLDYRSMNVLTTGLRSRPALRKLRLAGCQINHSSAELLCDLLADNIPLEDLDVAFNNLALKGAERMSQALTVNSRLISLNVRHNSIGRDGGVLFADALKTNCTLCRLRIVDNEVGDDVMVFISARLHGNVADIENGVCFRELQVPDKYLPENYGILKKGMLTDRENNVNDDSG